MADTSDRPSNREGFKIAIICAVQPEWEAVNLQLDVSYETEGISYGKLNNDQNAYTTGRFGGQHAVLVRMPGMGIAPAAACAASLRMSFPCVELVLLVGICGAAPYTADHRDILLGDVIIGSSVVPIGVGRLYPNGFKRKSSVEETVGRAPVEIRAFLGKVNYTLLEKKTAVHVAECYARDRRFPYPAAESDRLYRPDYQHMHQNPGSCSSCVKRESSAEEVCQDAASISCTELGCEDSQLLRDRGRRVDEPRVHVGPIASSDSVIKSGIYRDEIVKREKVIAFEMEGAGAWDYASIIIIKSVCDYADSHKNKSWQQYASVTAAACTKALLEQWRPSYALKILNHSGGLIPSPLNGPVGSNYPSYSSARTKRKRQGDDQASTSRLRRFVKSFHNHDYHREFQRKAKERHGHTCFWILENPQILEWRTCQSSRLLWLRGNPGVGKSTLLTCLVEAFGKEGFDQQQHPGENSALIYSFCDTQLNSTARSVLSTVIHQLLVQLPDQQETAMEVSNNLSTIKLGYLVSSDHRPVQHLWTILNQLFRKSNIDVLYFILDGLDECERESQQELLRLFSGAPSSFKILVSSRPSEYLRGEFSQQKENPALGVTYLDLEHQGKHIIRDIDSYIDKEIERIGELRGYQAQHKEAARWALKRDHSQLFLPVKLSLKKLEVISPGRLSSALDNLSKELAEDLNYMYERIIRDLPQCVLSTRCEIFKYLIYSRSRLTIDQLMAACPPDGGEKTDVRSKITNEDRDRFRKDLMLYGPIVRVRPDDIVEFVHVSAKEFLLLPKSQQAFQSLLVCRSQAQREISIDCLEILLSYSWKPAPEPWESKWKEKEEKFLQDSILLGYALRHWYEHLKDATANCSPDSIDKKILELMKRLARLWRTPKTAGFRRMILEGCGLYSAIDKKDDFLSTLQVFSGLGLAPFVEILLRDNGFPKTYCLTPNVKSALKLAIKGGHAETLDLLAENFRVDSLDGHDFRGVVMDASRSGNSVVLEKTLRMRKAQVTEMVFAVIGAMASGNRDAYDTLIGETSVFEARDRSNMTVLHRLFADNFDSDLSPETAIVLAAEFVERGVDVCAEDCIGNTALHYACHSRSLSNSRVIETLIGMGADPCRPNKAGWTPFHLLARYTRDPCAIDTLLELGGNTLIEAKTNSGRTALQWACQRYISSPDTGDVIKALVNKGADPRSLSSSDRDRYCIKM